MIRARVWPSVARDASLAKVAGCGWGGGYENINGLRHGKDE